MVKLLKCKISASLLVYFYRRHYFPIFLENSSQRCSREAACDEGAKTVTLIGRVCKNVNNV